MAFWPIPVGHLANTGRRFCQYWLEILPILVEVFAYTGEGTFSKIWAGLRSKSGILKTLGVLELCLDMGSRIKRENSEYNRVVITTLKIDFATEVSL